MERANKPLTLEQLREELAMVTAERDAAVADLRWLVPAWKWDGQKEKIDNGV